MINQDLEFLTQLDKKLHFKLEIGNSFSKYGKGYVDGYTNEKMNKEEVEEVLRISQGLNYVIYPINTCMGFAVGYDLCEINPIGKKTSVLRFKEKQLPKEYNFERMSEVFMDKSNLNKAKLIEVEIVNSHSHYDY